MILSELIDQIDSELQQDGSGHLTSTTDEYRITRKKLIITWTNQILKRLSGMNQSFWKKEIEITVPSKTNTFVLPNYIQKLISIRINNSKAYKIQSNNNNNESIFYQIDSNKIKSDIYEFESGTKIKVFGVFKPNDVMDDDNCIIDIPFNHERLLIVMIINNHYNRIGTPNSVVYAEQKQLYNEFIHSQTVIDDFAKIRSGVSI